MLINSTNLPDALPLLSTPQVIPSQGTTLVQTGSSATQPEVTVLHPQTSLESSILVQNGVSDSDKDSRSTNSDDQVEEMVGSDTEYTEDSDVITTPNSQVVPFSDEVARGVKLGTSKSPVIEAFVYCALQGWGVHIKKSTRNEVEFIVTDFDYYYACSNRICSKQRPTEDISARIKGLKRWFPDFPARKAQISGTFTVSVGKGNNKIHKIRKIMNKNRELIGIYKMRRSR